MDYIPEMIAQFSFLPSGIFMGYIFYIFEFATTNRLENITYFPYIIGFSAAFLIALLYSAFKSNKRQEIYQQFHILVGGSILYIIGGGLFMLKIATPGVYIAGLSHGITYVSSFSYLKLRLTASKRSFRLAVCHVWYLFGCALSIQLMNEARELNKINEVIGACLLTSSCIVLILLTINEILQYCKLLNYKKSLDETINKVNMDKTLVLNRKQLIASLEASHHRPGYAVVKIRDTQKSPSFWLVLLKLKGAMLFSSVIMDYSIRATNLHNHMQNFSFIQWITLAGCGMSLLAYTFFNKNVLFYLFCACQLLGLIAAVVVYSNDTSLMEASVPLWMYYVFMGAGYCIADIVLVEVSSIQKTEIVLSIGYLIEFLPVTVIQYCRFYAPHAVYLDDYVLTFKAHVISFICITVVLMLLFLLNMPKTQDKSLLDIRNHIFGIKFIKQLSTPADEFRSFDYPRRHEPPANTTYPFEVAPTYPQQRNSEVPTQAAPSAPPLSTVYENPYRLPPPTNAQNRPDGIYRTVPNPNIGVGMNRGSTDFYLMNPSNIMPKAIVGGLFLGAMTTNL